MARTNLTSPLFTGAANTTTQRVKTKKMARMTSGKIDLGNRGADISNWQTDREFDPTFSVIIVKDEGAQLRVQTLCAWMGEASSQISTLGKKISSNIYRFLLWFLQTPLSPKTTWVALVPI